MLQNQNPMKFFLSFLFCCLVSAVTSNAQYAVATGDGGYVLNSVCQQHSGISFDVSRVEVSTTQEGKPRLFLPGDAVDKSVVGQFYLYPQVVGEENFRTTPIFLIKVSGGYEFATTAMFSIEDHKLYFARQEVTAFEVWPTEEQSYGLVPE